MSVTAAMMVDDCVKNDALSFFLAILVKQMRDTVGEGDGSTTWPKKFQTVAVRALSRVRGQTTLKSISKVCKATTGIHQL